MPATATLVDVYLRGRGITLPIPEDVRFVPSPDPKLAPCMAAIVRQIDGSITACQITGLKPDGSDRLRDDQMKQSRGVLGTGAVRLGLPEDELGLAEGVETGLSAQQMSGIPVWVALGSRLSRVAIPKKVRRLVIFADRGKAGEKAARDAWNLYRDAPQLRTEVRLPLAGFGDFNDQLRGASAGRTA